MDAPLPHRLLALPVLVLAALAAPLAASAEEPPEPPIPAQTVVTGTRTEQRAADVTVPTEIITRREIESSGARDLSELLQTQPGVEIVQTIRGAGVRLQGLDPEYVLILIDGERAGGRSGAILDLGRYSLRDVERVEIVKGPASVLYGSDAIGGVINLITRRPTAPLQGEASASYGNRQQLDLRGGGSAARGPLEVSLGGGFRSAEAFDLDPRDVATTGSALGSFEAGGDLAFKPSDALRLALKLDYSRRDLSGVDISTTGATIDRHGRTEVFTTSARSRWDAAPDTDVQGWVHFSLFRDQLLQDQRLARDLDQYTEARERLWEAGLQLDRKVGSHLLTAGVEGLWEGLTSPRLVDGRGQRARGAVLAQDDWQVLGSPRVAVMPGLRLDLDSKFGPSVSPRLAVRADPLSGLTLRAAYGWGFRAPSFQEQLLRFENPSVGYVVEGNPALKPEKSQGLSLSSDYQPTDWAQVSLSLFRTDVRDLISIVTLADATPDSPLRFGYDNLETAVTQGVEASVRLRLLRGVWLDLGYALTDARDGETHQLLEGRALHRGTVQLLGRYRPWGVDATVRAALVGKRPFYFEVEPVWASPYADVDIRVSKQLFGFLSLFAVASNLLGAGDPLYLPLPPRSFHAGVSARY